LAQVFVAQHLGIFCCLVFPQLFCCFAKAETAKMGKGKMCIQNKAREKAFKKEKAEKDIADSDKFFNKLEKEMKYAKKNDKNPWRLEIAQNFQVEKSGDAKGKGKGKDKGKDKGKGKGKDIPVNPISTYGRIEPLSKAALEDGSDEEEPLWHTISAWEKPALGTFGVSKDGKAKTKSPAAAAQASSQLATSDQPVSKKKKKNRRGGGAQKRKWAPSGADSHEEMRPERLQVQSGSTRKRIAENELQKIEAKTTNLKKRKKTH